MSALVVLAFIFMGIILFAGAKIRSILRAPLVALIEEARRITEIVRRAETTDVLRPQKLLEDEPGPVAAASRALLVQAHRPDGGFARTMSARDSLDEDLIISSLPGWRWMEVAPNMFIGIGLLITFALLAASIGIAGGDGSQESLGLLLGTAGFKFMTSIAAILVSLALIFDRTSLLKQADQALATLADEFDARIPALPSYDPSDDVAAIRAQTAMIARVRDEVVEAADGRETMLTNALTAALQPLARSVAEMGETVAATNEDTMKSMVEAFSRELGSATARHNQDLAAILDATTQVLKTAPDQLRGAANAMASSLGDAQDRLTALTDASNRSLTVTADRLEAIARAASASESRLADRVDAATAEANAAAARLREFTDEVQATTATISSAATVIGDAATAITGAAASSGQAASALISAADTARAAERQMTGDINAWASGMEQVDVRVSSILAKIPTLAPPVPPSGNETDTTIQ